jgi:hypothetical protein
LEGPYCPPLEDLLIRRYGKNSLKELEGIFTNQNVDGSLLLSLVLSLEAIFKVYYANL